MKFDKAMELAYRILAILTCTALILGVVSCSKAYSIKVSAVEISASEQAGIQDYIEAGQQGLINIDFRLDSDEDGNRSTRLQIQGLQNLTFNEQFRVYDNMDFSIAPDSLSMSGGGLSCLYRNYFDNNVYPVTINLLSSDITGTSYTFVTAKDFTVKCVGYQNGIRFSTYLDKNYSSSTWQFGLGINRPNQYNIPWATYSFSGALADYSYDIGDSSGVGSVFYISKNDIPTIQKLNERDYIGGMGQELTLPPGDYDSTKPWEYYNDTLLPYIRQNFNIENLEQYLVFPDGYTPLQDPTEPPSIIPGTPGDGVTVIAPVIIGVGGIFNIDGVDFDIFAPVKGQLSIDGIDFQFPRDDSSKVYINQTPYTIPLPEIELNGHTIALPDINTLIFDGAEFIINSDGSLTFNEQNYPLPIGQPETIESNVQYYIYKYEIPTLENINIPNAELEVPDLSQFTNSLSLISSVTVDFVEKLGLMPFIIAMLSLGVLGYALWKIGG